MSFQKPTLISFARFRDGRGWFSQQWQESWKEKVGISDAMVQTNMGYSTKRNTIRGLHSQVGMAKLVTVVTGKIMDIVVDPNGKHYKFILSAEFPQSLYIPKGYCHGYRTLEDNTIMMYQQDKLYNPKLEYGVRWDDPKLNIDWELDGDPHISERDLNLPLWSK